MESRTTAWRRRKFGTPTDGRGRNLNSERAERLAFVGAVAAQLIAQGFATHSGLKTYGQRVPTEREKDLKNRLSLAMTCGNKPEVERLLVQLGEESQKAVCGDSLAVWVRPPGAVWQAIESAPFNADCVALAAAYLGKTLYETRSAKLRGTGYSSSTPRRKREQDTYWKAIEGMTRQTASYWTSARKREYGNALRWLAVLLQGHGLLDRPIRRDDLATISRDDLADILAGKKLRTPKTGQSAPLLSHKLRKGSFAPSNHSGG